MVSGSGTNLQSILDAVAAGELPLDIAAVGADKPCLGIERAQAAGVPTFLVQPGDYADRPSWNRALEEKIASYDPDYIVFAGFMRIVDAQLVERFSNRIINRCRSLAVCGTDENCMVGIFHLTIGEIIPISILQRQWKT